VPDEIYDLVCLVADADADRFLKAIIGRGIERGCIAPIRWKVVIDPMKDNMVVRRADATLRAFARDPHPRIVVLWDHHGSGRETEDPATVEASVVALVTRTGIPADNILALAAVPEFETILGPVWANVARHIANPGPAGQPAVAFDVTDPKGSLMNVARKASVRWGPRLFHALGEKLSIPDLKQSSIGRRFADRLEAWFPGAGHS
jgi:hypothetical protein